jgi:hypothetical protein
VVTKALCMRLTPSRTSIPRAHKTAKLELRANGQN